MNELKQYGIQNEPAEKEHTPFSRSEPEAPQCIQTTSASSAADETATPSGSSMPNETELSVVSKDLLFPAPEISDANDLAEAAVECRTVNEGKVKKPSFIIKLFSALLSFIFCTASVSFCIAEGYFCADKLFSGGPEALFFGEVLGTASKNEEASEKGSEKNGEIKNSGAENSAADKEDLQDYPIKYEDLSSAGNMTDLSNETAYTPDLEKLLAKKKSVGLLDTIYEQYGDDAPAVLIVHTHGTESYSDGGDTYNENTSFRTEDMTQNVVSVGEVFSQIFEKEGINTIHCTEMFDKDSYRESYSKSYTAVAQYLKDNPSIRYVFDVHRDSIIADNMTNIGTSGNYGKITTAQAMIVVGTDEGGADHERWEDNLSFALSVQNVMMSLSPNLPRRINLRSAAFNQGLARGYLLLEIGSCGNTLAEAKACAVLCASSIAEAIKGKKISSDISKLMEEFVR